MESNYFPHIETRKVITFRIFDAGSKTEFTNNLLKTPKMGKLKIDTLITPKGLLINEKNQTKKSHATVPLIGLYSLNSFFISNKEEILLFFLLL